MIELKNVTKTFSAGSNTVHAVKDVSLVIEKGEIFGIIGFSGAGKSTLVRCINLLERPNSGKVFVDDKELTALSARDLRKARKKIGMIFQHFNLMPSRTVADNVEYSLFGSGLTKAQKKAKVRELSGGQKQRVAIARALANDPKVLLCDEATSALDPQTTASILELLQSLNKKLGITIVVITHEMAVVKQICDRVAVMENGNVVEEGDVFSIFANPKHQITKDFIKTTSNLQKIEGLIASGSDVVKLSPGEVILRLSYKKANTSEALISEVSRKFNINLNIIYADVEIVKGAPIGGTVAIVSGQKADIDAAIKHLHDKEVGVEVIKDERIFTHSLTKHIG